MTTYKGSEFVNCLLCEKDNTELLFSAPVQEYQKGYFSFDEWNIVKCKQCGLIYVNPRISQEANNNYYKFQLEGDHEFLNHHFVDTANIQTSYWRRMVRVVKQYKPSGGLLDVGCGNGAFLVLAKESGYKVEGQDISPYFINYCKQTHGLSIHNGELSALHLPDNTFDVVSLFDVIEHHRQPIALLHEIKRILKPDGLIIISTHDIGNIFAKHYGDKWRMIYPIGHLVYYTRKTMVTTLEKSGYHVIRCGGANTIDTSRMREWGNALRSWFTTIFLRAIILYIYKPITRIIPFLRKIRIKYQGTTLSHDLILFKAGDQIISNDEMVIIARPNNNS